MTYVVIKRDSGNDVELAIDTEAAEAVRLKFNSDRADVEILKTLAGAFITYCNYLRECTPNSAREYAVAITEAQTASMWAVSGATKDLYKSQPKI